MDSRILPNRDKSRRSRCPQAKHPERRRSPIIPAINSPTLANNSRTLGNNSLTLANNSPTLANISPTLGNNSPTRR